MSRTGLSDVAIGCWQTLKPTSGDGEAAMATVYVVTAGSGDSYRIERVYLDSEQAYGFAQDYNGIAPVEPVHVEEWQIGAPPAAYDGPYWRAEWWARIPVAKRRGALRHTDEGERFDDFAIRQEWWTGEALPEATVVRRELTGVPKIEVVGPVQGEGGGDLLGHGHPGHGPTWRESRGNNFRYFVRRMERNGHGDSTLPPWSVMMTAWTDTPWNGSATTS